jgi:DNA methyltransferase 1-associated protein 1
MKDELKDILSIPNHIIYNEKIVEKEERGSRKEETKKANVASKDILGVTKTVFPLKVSKILHAPKKHGQFEGVHTHWVLSHIKFDEENSEFKPKILQWMQEKDLNKKFKFAKYDLPLVMPKFTSDEYDEHLANMDLSWKKEETLYLWELLEKYEMRFFVVFDRYDTQKYPRTLDELKHRFYSIAKVLAEIRGERNSPYLNYVFDLNYEKHRKYQLEKYIIRGKDKTEEEKILNEDLKKIELMIKKKEREQRNLKKMITLSKDSENPAKMQDIIEQVENKQHNIFTQEDKCVYLRGSIMHGGLPSLSAKLNKKIETVMKELSIPDKPMPTKNIHALYDNLRKNIVKMFSLQITLKNKEEEKKRLQEKLDKQKEAEALSLQKRAPDMSSSHDPRAQKKIKKP